MKSIALFLTILCLFTATAFSQTNQWFNKGDLTLEIGPLITLPSIAHVTSRYGVSISTTYWQTESTATSVEVGDLDIRNFNPELIDHISALEKVRVVPFYQNPIFGRIALIGITGTDTRFYDGSKGIIVGLETDVAITKNLRVVGRLDESFETVAVDSGTQGFVGLQFKF
jgi:hypothetical protein